MSARVYIGRLSYNTREKDVERFFRPYGRIRDIMLKNGYGFIEFDDYRDADDAVYELNGRTLNGERVIVELARGPGSGPPPPRRRYEERRPYYGGGGGGGPGGGRNKYGPPVRTDYRVIVENLSTRVSWQDLKDYMRQAGEVTYADAHKQHRNEGIVEFQSYSDMKTAIEQLDGTELNGRRVKVHEDKGRRRSSSRSRSRSSHSRSRSRSRKESRSRSASKSKSKSRSRSRSRSASRRSSKSRSKTKSPVKESSPTAEQPPDEAQENGEVQQQEEEDTES